MVNVGIDSRTGRFKKGLIPWNKGRPHSSETLAKLKSRHTSPRTEFKKGHRPTEKTRKKQSKSAKKRFANPAEREKQSIRLSIIMKKRWQEESYIEKQKLARDIKPNNIEIILKELLNRLFPNEYKYVGDFSFILGGKCPDFMNINGKKKLIELYGDYYHNPKHFPQNMSPEERIAHFKKYGFEALVIWERELKNEFQLTRILQEFHGG